MNKHLSFYFIVNPVSGKGAGKKIVPFIEQFFTKKQIRFQIAVSSFAGEGKTLAEEAVKTTFDVIVAVGGDGTVNEVASCVFKSTKILGIIPIGSGNGLAREMNIPQDYKNAVRNLLSGAIIKADTGLANQTFFACTAGVGFDAHLANQFLRIEKRGLTGYIRTFLNEFFNYPSKTYSLLIDDSEITEDAWLITIANQRQWGNNFYISPLSKFNDAKMEVCLLKKFPVYVLPVLLWRILFKSLHKSGYFKTISASNVKITTSKPDVFHTDGEIHSLENTLEISVLPLSLTIISGK